MTNWWKARAESTTAAYTIGSCWAEPKKEVREAMLADYTAFYKEAAGSFLAQVLHWYAADPCAETWWAQARETVALPFISDKQAFVMVSAGFASPFPSAPVSPAAVASAAVAGTTWKSTK